MSHNLPACILIPFLILTSWQLTPNHKSQTISNPLDIKMSPNEALYSAYNLSHFGLYNSYTGKQIKLIQMQSIPTDIAFSHDSKMLAVSQIDGNVTIFRVGQGDGDARVQRMSRLRRGDFVSRGDRDEGKMDQGEMVEDGGDESDAVIGICFTYQSQSLIILHFNGLIMCWTLQGLVMFGAYQGVPLTVACSSTNPNLFSIGILDQNLTTQIISYSITYQSLQLLPLPIVYNTEHLQTIHYLTYTPSEQLLVVGDSQTVMGYKAPDYEPRIVYQEGNSVQLFKVGVGLDGGIIAVCNATHAIVVTGVTDGHGHEYGVGQSYYQTNWKTFGLAETGYRFLYADKQNNANILDRCQEGQYFQQKTSQCLKCNQTCTICSSHNSSGICFECKTRHYLSSSFCLLCGQRCLSCLNSTICQQCMSPFDIIDHNEQKICDCQNGYEFNDDKCQRGLEFWVFAVITGGASLVLGCLACKFVVILVVNIMVMRKREKRRNLLGDQDGND